MNLDKLIEVALNEDMPEGDITTDSLQLQDRVGRARLIAKEDQVLSGADVFAKVFAAVDSSVQIQWQFENGQLILKGQTVAAIQGRLSSILKAERVALNFLGHLSGVATFTRCFTEQIRHTKTKILDTRKTTPCMRELEKAAVRDGGGENHRMNLSDGILIKENHIRFAGGIANAIKAVRVYSSKRVEVETRNLEEVRQAVAGQVGQIMFDNMSTEQMREALRLVPASIQTEASGNMTLERVREVAELGVNFISVGAITHSAPSADFSLMVES